jgi:RNA polymerase sigma factor (sigma-70 family)
VLVLDDSAVGRLYKAARADKWGVAAERFREALEASLARSFPGGVHSATEAERHLAGLHLEDLALACACAEGNADAWEHLVREYRPVLYRSADALEGSGGAREIADSVYADLYARSLFRYFHGRSSLATWLRSVVAQRYVDAVRARRRLDPLPDEDDAIRPASVLPDPDATRYRELIESALRTAIDGLPPRDRLRLACYYAQQATLAEVGRLLGEHEATVSRQLARTRRAVRTAVDNALHTAGLQEVEVARCVETVLEDAGGLDLNSLFAKTIRRKVSDAERSQ